MNIGTHGGSCGHSCCLRIQDLSVKIGKDSILRDVNMHLHCGQIVALIGPNGAGKSTLLKAVLGEREYEGIISFSVPGQRTRKALIGYVPQSPAFDPGDPVTVADLFACCMSRRPAFLGLGKKMRETVMECLERVHGEDLIDREDIVITITHGGYIKRLPVDEYKAQGRGGKGITAHRPKDEDYVEKMFVACTHDPILLFSSKGKVYSIKGYEIPEANRTARGRAIVNVIQLDQGEKIAAVIPVKNFDEKLNVLMATKNGLVKKTALSEYSNIRKTGIIGITLKDEDEIIDVRITDGTSDVILVTRTGLSIRFNEEEARPVGRTSMGVKGITLGKDDYIVSALPVRHATDDLAVFTANGLCKKFPLSELPSQKRAGKGLLCYKPTDSTGNVVSAALVDDTDNILVLGNNSSICVASTEIPRLSRASTGNQVIKNSKINSVSKV